MGKPGHIGKKIAATFSSLGTPSFYLHPAEALHGDLGTVTKEDLVIIISFSGESDEIVKILPNLKLIGVKIIGITGKPQSTLAKSSDYNLILPKFLSTKVNFFVNLFFKLFISLCFISIT